MASVESTLKDATAEGGSGVGRQVGSMEPIDARREKASVLEAATQNMTLRLQIASKLVHECRSLEEVSDSVIKYAQQFIGTFQAAELNGSHLFNTKQLNIIQFLHLLFVTLSILESV